MNNISIEFNWNVTDIFRVKTVTADLALIKSRPEERSHFFINQFPKKLHDNQQTDQNTREKTNSRIKPGIWSFIFVFVDRPNITKFSCLVSDDWVSSVVVDRLVFHSAV